MILVALTLAFAVLQFIRLRRALHIFQLEGYKRARFLVWCSRHRGRSLFLKATGAKKPLVMTGRAWRLLITATVLTVAPVVSAAARFSVLSWALLMLVLTLYTYTFLVVADFLLAPVQSLINGRYMRAARRRLDDIAPLVVGVTGSFGKTSTKFAIRDLIGPPGSALATPGSYNTPLGVCRAINEQLEPTHRYLIVEMGAYREGDIAELCAFVRPSVGVLTAIGPAHLERFGSPEAIRRAKYEIVTSLSPDGTAVMNVDDSTVRALADDTTNVRVVR
ncbi:MAG: Mur ligase family protein, partial [Actinomycetota bacterium]